MQRICASSRNLAGGCGVQAAIAGIYDAATGDSDWEAALAGLMTPLRARTVILEHRPVGTDRTEHFIAAGARSDPLHILEWENRGNDERIDLPLSPDQLLTVNDFAGVHCSPNFISLLTRYSVARCISGCVAVHVGTRFLLHATRPAGAPRFTPADEELFRWLMRHLRKALDIGAQIEQIDNVARLHADALHGTGIGLILVDPQGSAHCLNINAERLLSSQADIFLSGQRLSVRDRLLDRELQSLLALALALPYAAPAKLVGALRIDLSEDFDCQIGVKSVALRDHPAKPLSRCAVLYMLEGKHRFGGDNPTMRKTFGLTPKETEIVQMMLQGADFDHVQSQLAICYSTLRFHLGSIYEKFRVRNKMELIRLLSMLGPIFVAGGDDDLPATVHKRPGQAIGAAIRARLN